ncbi:NADPH-dependent ferric siderophore reductase, contains FAD-binding and SIP domains [Mycobacterium rhizamassiliense]|uniref:NADPH-dependent ferric siderophore reductase, contains FAD-binding and SIP domains n=1 Tax=Mycobacterium rhizamassiliense TaxID=1841860 RepID=A0A2U3NVM0_9MYCO|nr:siderophore-interacting protein [Mycobacterium rhizamassiliense]SPM35560.1 NADPH-dependent ferric siderophore reductase, contains FAD-binding and SIP domains [Mycobacterium rhizamassiliense]
MTEHTASRGWQGAVLKLFGAGEHRLTVTGRRQISPHYLSLSFDGGGMLARHSVHPTMWIRMWFPNGDKVHQRGYTLVDPDPAADTFDVEFALHDGAASRWAREAQPGDTIEATVLGSRFEIPEPAPAGYVIVGDSASLPAINSLLASIGDVPARVFLEAGHDDDKDLPVVVGPDITWVDRKDGGRALLEAVRAAAFDAGDHYGWVASDNRTTRSVAGVLRDDFGIPRKSIKAQAYWMA